jgi:hypothetical protein
MLCSGSSLLNLVWRRLSSHVSTVFSEAAKREKPGAALGCIQAAGRCSIRVDIVALALSGDSDTTNTSTSRFSAKCRLHRSRK